MAEPQLLDLIANCVLALDAKKLPTQVQTQAKLLILDSIGCALTTLDEHEVTEAIEAIESCGGAPQATIIGSKGKTSIGHATLANGILVRYLDLNDFTLGTGKSGVSIGGHPSDNIPVALAVGEWRGSSGLDVIASIVAGYDMFERLRAVFDSKGRWDGTSVSGVVTAAMAGRLMKFDATKMVNAIALAAMRSATPRLVRRGHITAAKFLSNPLIAETGVTSAVLANGGMTGPKAILEDVDGLRSLFRENADFSLLHEPIGDPYAINLAHIKAFPCLATGQAEVAASIEMHKLLGGRTDHIEKFEVIMADYHMVREQQGDVARRYPDSREAADHSFYFLAAISMMEGGLSMRTYDNARWTDPTVTALMAKGAMARDAGWNTKAPNGYPCALEVTLKDGSKLRTEVAYAPGHSHGSLDESAVIEKFDRVTRDVLTPTEQGRVKETVLRLEKLDSIAPLMEMVADKRR